MSCCHQHSSGTGTQATLLPTGSSGCGSDVLFLWQLPAPHWRVSHPFCILQRVLTCCEGWSVKHLGIINAMCVPCVPALRASWVAEPMPSHFEPLCTDCEHELSVMRCLWAPSWRQTATLPAPTTWRSYIFIWIYLLHSLSFWGVTWKGSTNGHVSDGTLILSVCK